MDYLKLIGIRYKKQGVTMLKYKCTICGYVYDPKKGDQNAPVAAGTSFEDLPFDWICPICRVSKSKFIPEKK